MNKWEAQSQLIIGDFFLVLFMYVFNSPAIEVYISSVKGQPVNATVEREDWAKKLYELKEKHDISPKNARIDPVWKAIPGYNGLAVNVEATLAKFKKMGKWDDKEIVFTEVEPEKNLSDYQPSPIYRGNPEKPMVSFMVNVAWGNEYLPEILKTLEKYQAKSTFFLDGSWVSKYPDMAKQIKEAGHEIANHAYSHPDMKTISMNRIRLELTKTNEVIQKELNVKPVLFAPPSGSYDDRVVQLAAGEGMKTILWTLDTVDWKKPTPETIINRISPQLSNGSLILMHPTESSAKALPSMMEAAQKKGLKVGTVSELLSPKRIYSIE